MDHALSKEVETQVEKRPGRLREFWFYFRENRGAVFGFWVFLAFVFVAATAPGSRRTTPPSSSARSRWSRRSGRRVAAGPSRWAPTLWVATCSRGF